MTADGYATEFEQLAAGAADKALSIVAALAQCPEPALRVVRAIVAERDRLRAEVAALRAENDRLLSQLPIEAVRADLDGMGVDCEPAIARVLAAVRSARERAGHPPAPTPADLLDAETQE